MSYCRRYDRKHEVYMYSTWRYIECCGCLLKARRCNLGELHLKGIAPNVQFKTRSKALKHLFEHKKHGQGVPRSAIAMLRREIRLWDKVKGSDLLVE